MTQLLSPEVSRKPFYNMKLRLLRILTLLYLPFFAFADNENVDNYSKLICPDDITITCTEFRNLYGNYSSLGHPQYNSYCISNLQERIENQSNFCGLGEIYRIWTAWDVCSWQYVSCKQVITVVAPPEDWVIQFPADKTLECVALEDLPDFGDPILYNDDCEDIKVNYRDEVFESVEDACYKVVRTWTAINWCTYNINIGDRVVEKPEDELVRNEDYYNYNEDLDRDGDEDRRTYQVGVFDVRNTFDPYDHYSNYLAPDPDGYITHKQVIKVRDSSTPEIQDIPDLEVCIEEGCSTPVALPDVEVYDCSGRVTGTWTTNIPNINAATVGDYTATYTVADNCGNFAQKSISIMVSDCAPPVSYCRDLSIDLMITGEVTIWANDFNVGSYDDCTDINLAFSPNPRDTGLTFTCLNLGYNQVQIYSIDPAGNYSICEAVVYVGDSQFACENGEPARIVGTVFTRDYEYVSDVEVHLSGNNTQQVMTNDLGFYDLRGLVRENDYTIVPQKDTSPTEGIDNNDLQLLIQHVTGIKGIEDPYRLIAADVNNSGAVDAQDIVALRRVINGGMDHFPNNTSWRFIPKDFEFEAGEDPLSMDYPEFVNINNLDTTLTVFNFFAVKIGDLDRSWERGLSLDNSTQIHTTESITFNEVPVAFPNPFKETTTLRFDLAQAGQVKLTVTDLSGRELLREVKLLDKGQQVWDIDGANLKHNGILLYQLETTAGIFTGKIVRL